MDAHLSLCGQGYFSYLADLIFCGSASKWEEAELTKPGLQLKCLDRARVGRADEGQRVRRPSSLQINDNNNNIYANKQ